MALLDFIKNRNAQTPAAEQQSQQSRDETYKQQMTRESAEEKANRVSPTEDQKARAQEIGKEMRSALQPAQKEAPTSPASPSDQGSNSAQRQNQSNQGKEQAALSPTDDASGKTAAQDKSPAPEKTTESPRQTQARKPPSWER